MHSISKTLRTVSRLALGSLLLTAGIGHLGKKRQEFQAQVPDWVPLSKDTVVLASGGVEVALGPVRHQDLCLWARHGPQAHHPPSFPADSRALGCVVHTLHSHTVNPSRTFRKHQPHPLLLAS